MKNSDYWRDRFKQLEAAQNRKGADTYRLIEEQYRQAQKELEGKINTWYQRFATNNGVSMAEARRMLRDRELAELKWDVKEYIKRGQENAFTGQWVKELENASARFHISRLEALKLQTQQSLELMFGNQLDSIDAAMKRIYLDGYYHTAYELQKGFSIGWDIAGLDQRQIEKVIRKPWAADGKNFSERVWGNKEKLITEVHRELTQDILLGRDPQKAIDNIARKMNASKDNAGRLIMTEEAYFSSAAQKDCFRDLGVEQYEIVATLDSHTSDICQSLDGQVFPMKDFEPGITAPPFHVNCVLPDNVLYIPDATMLTRSKYSGDVIEIVTANGSRVSVTPNHIVLTMRGWMRAQNIVEGDKIIYYNGWKKFIGETNPANNHCIPTIENLFTSLIEDGFVIPTTVPASTKDFKGDIAENSKINIIFVDSLLRSKINFTQRKFLSDSTLVGTFELGNSKIILPHKCTAAGLLMGIGLASDGVMCGKAISDILLMGALTHHELVGFRKSAHYNARLFKAAFNGSCRDTEMLGKFFYAGTSLIHGNDIGNGENLSGVGVSDFDSIFAENTPNRFVADAKCISDFCNAFSGIVQLDDVVNIKVKFYSGHVYDASSISTLYYCNGILSSNCRSTTVPYFDDDFGQVGERAARNAETGKTYYVPDNMTYKEWKEKFVDDENKESPKADYLVRSHTPGQDITKERTVVNEVISTMPEKIKQALDNGTIIDIGKDGASQYDYIHDILYVAKGADKTEVIHEIGHMVENKLLDKNKIEQLKTGFMAGVPFNNIVQEVYYDAGGNPVEIFLLKDNRFVSDYQGRLYVSDWSEIYDQNWNVRPEILKEFMSEPFREYIENPKRMEIEFPEFYQMIKEALG